MAIKKVYHAFLLFLLIDANYVCMYVCTATTSAATTVNEGLVSLSTISYDRPIMVTIITVSMVAVSMRGRMNCRTWPPVWRQSTWDAAAGGWKKKKKSCCFER